MAIAIRGANPLWLYANLWGKLFDDTYYMWVLTNTIPYIPATVWHDPNESIPWTDPIQFLANGTLPIDIYFDPTQVYRLEFRQNNGLAPPSQQDALIYLVENYVPGSSGSTPITDEGFITDNQISNPQFALFSIANPLTLTSISTQNIDIAPGWVLELTGSGNVTLSQVAFSSSGANPTNAPYALNIQLSGSWSTALLRQRFFQNGMLWTNNVLPLLYVACSVTALISGAPQAISAQLIDSDANVLTEVLPLTELDGAMTQYTGFGQCTPTANTDIPPAAYVDFVVNLPTAVNLTMTSFQLIASSEPNEYLYEQTTINRQIDQTYHDAYPIVPIGTVIDYYAFGTPPHYVPCTGGTLNRQTFSQLFRALTNVETVTLTSGSATITVANGTIYAIGAPIEGAGIQASTAILSISSNTITMSQTATANGPSALTFFSVLNGDGSTTFNTPNLAGIVVAGAFGTLFASSGIGTGGGTSTYTLTTANLPPHTHAYNFPLAVNEGTNAGNSINAGTGSANNTGPGPGTSTPFSLVQPTVLVQKMIRYE